MRSASPARSKFARADLGVLLFQFKGHDVTVSTDGPSEPDRRVASECAELQDSVCAGDPCEQVEQCALIRGDLGIGHRGICPGLAGGDQSGVLWCQDAGEVVVDLSPSRC